MSNPPLKPPSIAKSEFAQPVVKRSGKAIASFLLGAASLFCAFVTGIVAIILGILALSDIARSQVPLKGRGLAIAGIVLGVLGCFWTIVLLIALTLPAVQQVREAARRAASTNNMRQMTIAMHNYAATYGSLPPASIHKDQKLSWRVHMLPFLDELELYEKFHLDEPWDSPHNLTLVDQMPVFYHNLNAMLEPGKTVYVVPYSMASAGKDTAAFVKDAPQGPQFSDFKDGTSNTILMLEVDPEAAVVWTDPGGDWEFDPTNPMRSLGGVRQAVFLVTYADGRTEAIPKSIPPKTLNAKFTRAAGD